MADQSEETVTKGPEPVGLKGGDYPLLWFSLAIWVVLFTIGTLVDSSPFRNRFMALDEPLFPDLVSDGLVVILTYTLTNVALLCIFAAILGTLGRRIQLGPDHIRNRSRDSVNPRSSAVLRGFVIYLSLISGVLVFGDDPAQPTQNQYVRLAGFSSLLSFALNWEPTFFIKLLNRIVKDSQTEPKTGVQE